MLQSQLVLVVMWAVAVLAMLWILGPLILFLSPLRRYEVELHDDPLAAEPNGDDRDFARSVAELKAAGFTPAGKTIERIRFFTPLHWLWVSDGSRWFASPDRRVFVSLYRLAAGHPQNMSANTAFEGGGLLSTTTTPAGLGGEVGERYRRVEVEDRGMAALLDEHARQVVDFSRDAGLRAKGATLVEMSAESQVMTLPFITRNRLASAYLVAAVILLPLVSFISMIGRPHQHPVVVPAFFCGLAAVHALFRLLFLPEFRRFRWGAIAVLVAAGLLLPKLLSR
jgi:hypothetical protein